MWQTCHQSTTACTHICTHKIHIHTSIHTQFGVFNQAKSTQIKGEHAGYGWIVCANLALCVHREHSLLAWLCCFTAGQAVALLVHQLWWSAVSQSTISPLCLALLWLTIFKTNQVAELEWTTPTDCPFTETKCSNIVFISPLLLIFLLLCHMTHSDLFQLLILPTADAFHWKCFNWLREWGCYTCRFCHRVMKIWYEDL